MFLNGKYIDIDELLFHLERKKVLKARNGVKRTIDQGV
jgi:hypothetical protein